MVRRTLNVLLVVGVFTFACGCQSGTSMTGMAVLAKSKAAIAEVKHVSYHAEYGATGWLVTMVPAVTGEVVMGPKSKWDLARFRCDVAITRNGSEETLRFVSGSNGDIFYLIDSKTEMAHEDMDPAVLGSNGRDIQRVLMSALVSDDPYGDDLTPDSVELIGSRSIGGVDCYEIRVKSDSPPQLVWMVSKKDFFPLRITRTYPNRRDPEGDPGTTHLTVTSLVVNPSFSKDPFVLSVPPGFTKTDEFAP